jgi:hypothetical protein
VAERPDHPLLALPAGVDGTRQIGPTIGGGAPNPKKARQIERLEPQFQELRRVLASRGATLSEAAAATAPEHVLVFVTNGPRRELTEVLASLPDLEWLLQHDERVEPDDDFRFKNNADKELIATFYMVMLNQRAVEQLLSFWKAYRDNRRMRSGFGSWGKVFACLREIRRWGPEDRLREAGLLRDWFDPIDPNNVVPVEIELWPRDIGRRAAVEQNVRELVGQANGRIIDTAVIEEIGYHAVLAELPQQYVMRLLNSRDVALVQADDVFIFRPIPQCMAHVDTSEARRASIRTAPLPDGEPVCALLDGLPMENHPLLQNRLVVDDPDDWAPTYQVAERKHGTAMASLIVRGDLHGDEAQLPSPLYVRPILQSQGQGENAPRHRLWLDLIHRAVLRLFVGDASAGPAAPHVRIINLSVGDLGRPFLHELSPLARLLDWLAWKYGVLFVISAGNHLCEIPDEHRGNDEAVIRHLFREKRLRRILCPAESLNGLTVGSLNHDGDATLSDSRAQVIPTRTDVPAAYSAQGRGFRQAVKPDVLMPGGRCLFHQKVPLSGQPWIGARGAPKLGQLVAVPGAPGETLTAKSSGTSNAAALTSRSGVFIHAAVEQLLQDPTAHALHNVPRGILLKALLTHTAEWPEETAALCAKALQDDVDRNRLKDHLAGVLGYGVLRPNRGASCSATRATAVGGGVILKDRRQLHRFPIPVCLHARNEWRRVTLTLAWFTPISPTDRRYRIARLRLESPKDMAPLNVTGGQVHGDAASRGTVQHLVLERENSAMLVGDDQAIEFGVTCAEDALELTTPIPYAVVVSLETAPGTGLPIYEQVAAALRVRVPVAVPR